jgi:hypothetical protein
MRMAPTTGIRPVDKRTKKECRIPRRSKDLEKNKEKTSTLGKAKLNLRNSSIEVVEKFQNQFMSECVVELPQEVSVKASQQFQDLELTRRSQAGDTEAFGELVTKYRTKIFTMVYGMVRNEHDAWDLAQEGFLKAW